MLHEIENIPEGLFDCEADRLYEVLPKPTLIHLPGRRPEPLFVSVLLHGNEDTGWLAVRKLLQECRDQPLSRSLSLFIGNIEAARYNQRYLAEQPDFNRIWEDLPDTKDLPERQLTRQVTEIMQRRGTFASIDIHNNTGINPHYACVRRMDHRFFHMATLFSRTVVYFEKPDGVQVEAFSEFCPAVTVECGLQGQAYGVDHALDYLRACLNLAEIPTHPIAPQDISLFHTVAIVKVPQHVSIGVNNGDDDIRLIDDIDHLNFRELPVDTVIGWVKPGSNAKLEVWDEKGREVGTRFLRIENGEIRTAVPVMPSMFTLNVRAIRQDCLGYLMESRKDFFETAMKRAQERLE